MNRSIAYVATGLCAAPLLLLAGMMLSRGVLRVGGGSDHTIAQGYVGILGGVALAIVGGALFWYLARQFVPGHRVAPLLAADAVVLVVGLVVWQRTFAAPSHLEYAGATALLQVEVRVPQSILAGDQVGSVVAIDFAGGSDASVPHPELARADGDAVIVPWETTPIRVNEWLVRVIVRDAELMFELPLAKVPGPAPNWAGWISPRADTSAAGRDVRLRYRYQVRAPGS